jgi:hypothetical protein
MKFRNKPNWFHVDRSSVAGDKIKTVLMCRRAARIDGISRVTVLPMNQGVSLLEGMDMRERRDVQGE